MRQEEQGFSSYDVTKRRLNKYEDGVEFKLELAYALKALAIAVDPVILDNVLQDLQSDPDVAWVEPDIVLGGTLPAKARGYLYGQHVPWGVERMGLSGNSASGVDIYVVDSGINAGRDIQLASSTDFALPYLTRAGLIIQESSLLGLTGINQILAADLVGHGTHIAGTIAARHNRYGIRGVVSGASLHNVRVLGPDGQTDMSTMLSAIDYIAQQKMLNPDRPMVVNVSIGADFGTSEYNALDRAIERSIELGITYVIAAGNDAINAATVTPAHVERAITVGAHNRENQYSTFSNFGAAIDILAPGEDIVSLSYLLGFQRVSGSGTSYAAPHVTGLAARYLSRHPTATPAEVRDALVQGGVADVSLAKAGTTTLRAEDF